MSTIDAVPPLSGVAEKEATTPPVSPPTIEREAISVGSSSWVPRRLRFMRPGYGIYNDFRSRAPYYLSDWTDAWSYRVVPATTLILFSNVLPGIAFSLDLIETTRQYGVTEILLSSFMAAFMFSVFGAQPLCIAGVTGPITVLNKTIFDVIESTPNAPNYLHFIGWVYLWGAIFHWISAVLNWCNYLQYVTLFSCDTYAFYVAWVYIQYGIQVITRQFPSSNPQSTNEGALVGIVCALLMLVTGFLFQALSNTSFFHRHVRRFLADYGMPISLVASSAVAYWGMFNAANPTTLPVGGAFQAANGREWLVRFWQLEAKWVGIAFPFGLALWILFLFDHNVSSLMAQGSQFPLRKPPGFHYDFFLLGITTLIAGLLGVPAPNGLVPQAAIHTRCLTVLGRKEKRDEETSRQKEDPEKPEKEVPVAVVEQRVSNLAQGALCLVFCTGPFLHVLNLIPRGVIAGLFWYMGLDALQENSVTHKILYFFRDKKLIPPSEPLNKVRKSRLLLFVVLELVGFAATMAITQTKGAIGFPVVILLLAPVRTLLVPNLPFTDEELAILDSPTASPFTMASVGGSL